MSESSSEQVPDGTTNRPPPPFLKPFGYVVAASLALLGAYSGWEGEAFVGLRSALACAGAGILLAGGYSVAVCCGNPDRDADGRLRVRATLVVILVMGVLGGLFPALVLWFGGLIFANGAVRLARALPAASPEEMPRTVVGAVLGILLGALLVWNILRRGKQ